MKIENTVTIVTGASSGIGLATARLLTKLGAKVALVARSHDKLEAISRDLPNSLVITTDMSRQDEVRKMVAKVGKHYGRIDILVNNAGQGYDAAIEYINCEIYHRLFDLDVVGPLIAMQMVIPIMRKQGQGVIVNISSGTALMYLPNMAAYSSAKSALVGVSLTAREELKRDNISVSVVYPYITDTQFEKNTIKGKTNDQNRQEGEDADFHLPPADTAQFVAEKIIEAIMTGKAEIFAHEWMTTAR